MRPKTVVTRDAEPFYNGNRALETHVESNAYKLPRNTGSQDLLERSNRGISVITTGQSNSCTCRSNRCIQTIVATFQRICKSHGA